MAQWETYLADNQSRFLEELLDFIRIPSISALPEHADDVQKAREWVSARLEAAGIEHVEVMPTGGHPVVYGDWLHAPGKPTILIYGHFDTQPVDPVELWTNPPFEPAVRNGRIYARGASDDKGGMIGPIFAVEALLKSTGSLPVNVKFIFEGQEEIGSPQLAQFLAKQRDRFACDLVISADGLQWSEDEAVLLLGLKGLSAVQIDVQGPGGDLHSGLHGGAVQNPIHALARLIDSMRSPDGKILIDGFFDDVIPLSEKDREHIAAVPFNEADYKASLGVDELFGEPGCSTLERTWTRPTLEVNGIWGGFQGEGTKTVIPSKAHAKITCRLVANQDPANIARLIAAHVDKHAPPGVQVQVQFLPGNSDPYLVPADHPGNEAARIVLEKLYGKTPYYTRLGGSVPVCSLFLKELRAYTISFAFSLDDENLHAPDEFFRLSSFERGQKGYCMLLEQLGESFTP
jgi:acetylornithine deacetylase/succinyl-diaminopimelate desuccinylase-like protein